MELKKKKYFKQIYNFLNKKWYFDRLYNQLISQNTLAYSYFFTYKNLDRGIIEFAGPTGITSIINISKNNLKGLQSGSIFHYLFLFTFSIILILVFSLFFQHLFQFVLLILFLIVYNFFI